MLWALCSCCFGWLRHGFKYQDESVFPNYNSLSLLFLLTKLLIHIAWKRARDCTLEKCKHSALCNRQWIWEKFTSACENEEAQQECVPHLQAELSQGCACTVPMDTTVFHLLLMHRGGWSEHHHAPHKAGTKPLQCRLFGARLAMCHPRQHEILNADFLVWTLPWHGTFRDKQFAKWIR